ncbi:DUF2958 domain-containing protein [uncultured Ruegeria sp.]|nr:DUF2958 domain-containing protein [uncultured Ruegeria sp.]
MQLLTSEQESQLLTNGKKQAAVRGTADEIDFEPVVKLFNPYGPGTWLLTELDPEQPDIAFGLADLGYPELGSISMSELKEWRHPLLGQGIERDLYWSPQRTLSAYADEARKAGYIAA